MPNMTSLPSLDLHHFTREQAVRRVKAFLKSHDASSTSRVELHVGCGRHSSKVLQAIESLLEQQHLTYSLKQKYTRPIFEVNVTCDTKEAVSGSRDGSVSSECDSQYLRSLKEKTKAGSPRPSGVIDSDAISSKNQAFFKRELSLDLSPPAYPNTPPRHRVSQEKAAWNAAADEKKNSERKESLLDKEHAMDDSRAALSIPRLTQPEGVPVDELKPFERKESLSGQEQTMKEAKAFQEALSLSFRAQKKDRTASEFQPEGKEEDELLAEALSRSLGDIGWDGRDEVSGVLPEEKGEDDLLAEALSRSMGDIRWYGRDEVSGVLPEEKGEDELMAEALSRSMSDVRWDGGQDKDFQTALEASRKEQQSKKRTSTLSKAEVKEAEQLLRVLRLSRAEARK